MRRPSAMDSGVRCGVQLSDRPSDALLSATSTGRQYDSNSASTAALPLDACFHGDQTLDV